MTTECSNVQMTKRLACPGFWPCALLGIGFLALWGCASEPVWKSRSYAFASPADPQATASRTNIVALRGVTISPLFQGRSFTYRSAENTYEHDPYAGFFAPPSGNLSSLSAPGCAMAGLLAASSRRTAACILRWRRRFPSTNFTGIFEKPANRLGCSSFILFFTKLARTGRGGF